MLDQVERFVNEINKALPAAINKAQKSEWPYVLGQQFAQGVKDYLAYIQAQSKKALAELEGQIKAISKPRPPGSTRRRRASRILSGGTIYTPTTITGPGGIKITVETRRDATLADWMHERDQIALAINNSRRPVLPT